MTKRRVLALVLSLALLSALSFPALAVPEQALPAFDRKVIDRIDIDNIWGHLEVLTQEIGPRVMGTTGERVAAQYIASVFTRYGYDVEFYEFPVNVNRVLAEAAVISPVFTQVFPAPCSRSALAPGDGVTGQVVDWGSSLTPPSDAAGKIALMDVPPGSTRYTQFNTEVAAATSAGAIAVALVFEETYLGQLGGGLSANASIPVIVLTHQDGTHIRTLLSLDTVTLNIQVDRGRPSRHVIATRKPKNPVKSSDEVLIFGAHYDSVHGAPGANDNASSVATLLELARVLASYPIDREIRFMAFGSEEGGGGAAHYVASLSSEEKARISGMVNMEMLGSAYAPQDTLHIMTVDGSTNFMTDAFVGAGARLGVGVPTAAVSGSDHVAFHNAGIKAVCFARAVPWTLPGGYGLEPQYHTPYDTMEYMSRERLEEAARLAGAAVYEILRPSTPNLNKSAIRAPH